MSKTAQNQGWAKRELKHVGAETKKPVSSLLPAKSAATPLSESQADCVRRIREALDLVRELANGNEPEMDGYEVAKAHASLDSLIGALKNARYERNQFKLGKERAEERLRLIEERGSDA